MASRALGAHRLDAVSRAATRGSSRRPFTRVHFLFLRPFVLAKLLHLNDSEGRKGNERRHRRDLALEQDGQERENRSHFSTKGKRARQQTPEAFSHSLLSVRFYDDNATFFDCLSPSAR